MKTGFFCLRRFVVSAEYMFTSYRIPPPFAIGVSSSRNFASADLFVSGHDGWGGGFVEQIHTEWDSIHLCQRSIHVMRLGLRQQRQSFRG